MRSEHYQIRNLPAATHVNPYHKAYLDKGCINLWLYLGMKRGLRKGQKSVREAFDC